MIDYGVGGGGVWVRMVPKETEVREVCVCVCVCVCVIKPALLPRAALTRDEELEPLRDSGLAPMGLGQGRNLGRVLQHEGGLQGKQNTGLRDQRHRGETWEGSEAPRASEAGVKHPTRTPHLPLDRPAPLPAHLSLSSSISHGLSPASSYHDNLLHLSCLTCTSVLSEVASKSSFSTWPTEGASVTFAFALRLVSKLSI